MKKILICILIAIFLIITGCTNVKETTNCDDNAIGTSSKNSGLSLYCDSNMVEVAYQNLIPTKEYIFPNGTKIFTTKNNARTIVMINGTYEPDIQVKIIDNILMVPIKEICECLDFKVDWLAESNTMIVKDNDLTITFKVDDTVAFVNNEKFDLELPTKIVENTIYIPWMFIYNLSDKLELNIEYYDKFSELDLFMWNPVITIDQELNLPYLSKEEAYKYLKSNLDYAYSNFEYNYKTLYNPDEDLLIGSSNMLKEDISNLKFTKTISRYYVFEGLRYTIYLDKYTKTTYFNIISIDSEIKKVNFDDPKLFEYSYMVN